jgi:hypothetical protein
MAHVERRALRATAAACVALTGLLGLPAPASAQWVVGAQGGVAAFSVGGDAPEEASYGRQTRLTAGLVLARHLSPSFVLRFEPGIVQKGTAVAFEVQGVEEPVDSLSLSLDYVSLPLLAQVFSPGGRGFVTAGVSLGILSSATLETVGGQSQGVEDFLADTDTSLMFGVGGLVLRGQPLLSLELRYEQSLTNAPGTRMESLPEGFRSSGFQLLAGLAWRLGG